MQTPKKSQDIFNNLINTIDQNSLDIDAIVKLIDL